MRKNKLFERMCVVTTVVCMTTQLFLYPVVSVSADDSLEAVTQAIEGDTKEQVSKEQVSLEQTLPEPSYGYYDTGYNAPIIEEIGYLGLSQAAVLPETYSSVAKGYVTDIKNQGSLGACWAFGPIAAMESYALRHGLVDSPSKIDLSEYALATLTFDDSTYTSSIGSAADDKTTTTDVYNCLMNGGNDQYVFKTLTKWAGLMNEADYPYIYAGNTESTYDASKVSYILTGQYFINMQNMDLVKQAIMDYGAVVAHYNANEEYFVDYYSRYHYTYETVATNHAIAIVGWDDTIPASSFAVVDADDSSVTHVPEGPGGWLIKNSWGTSWGNSGYMWISYYDKSIVNVSCCAYEIAPRGEYDYNYQHDGGSVMGYCLNFGTDTFANVFEVSGTDSQAIKAVSFGVEDVNREYSIMIYKNPDEDNPKSGTAMLDAPVTGITTYAGYYTVSLPEMIQLNSGDTFSVIIEFDEVTQIVTECKGSIYIGGGGYATTTRVCGDNQSYFCYNDTFYDTYEYNGGQYATNFCIKAMLVDFDGTIDASSITSIEKNGDTGFIISWQNVKDGIEYTLLRATEADGEYTSIYTGMNTSYVDTNISKYTTYYYKVRVYDGLTAKDSVARSAYIGVEGTEFTLGESKRNGIRLSWTQIEDVDGYKIYRSTDGVAFELLTTVDSAGVYTDTNVQYGVKYYYKIKTYVNVTTGNGSSIEESSESIVLGINRVVTAPSAITAEMNKFDKVSLSWSCVDDVDGFIIYRSYFDENHQYVTLEEVASVAGNVYTYDADIADIPRGDNATFYVKSYVNENSVRHLSEYVYDYVYILYPPVSNIKWYVSGGIMYVKWDEYVADDMTVTGYTAGVYRDLAGTSFVTASMPTSNSFYSVSMTVGSTFYVYVQAKNAMNTAFTSKQYPLVQIGGTWGEFAFENIADKQCSVGDTVTLTANLTYELDNFDYKYQWYKTVSKDGVGSGTAIAGAILPTYTLTVDDYGTAYYYCVCTGEYNGTKKATSNVVSVSALKSMSSVTIESIANQTYTGSSITPSVTVKDGSKTLVNGTDYTVSYSNNVNVGTATVTITGKGKYTGTRTVTFTIVAKTPEPEPETPTPTPTPTPEPETPTPTPEPEPETPTPTPTPTAPDKLTSISVNINQTTMKISKIKAGTKVSGLLATVDQKSYAVVYSGSSVVAGDKNVGTGMKLCLVDNGKITKTYTIIVTGDTNGDGKINITDMIAVKAHVLKKSTLSGTNGNAGDVNGDGKINITDFIKIKAALLGKDSIAGVTVK